MMSVSPRPVNPRPTRRFAIASACCALSGQAVTSSTSSSMRTETSTFLPKRSKSNAALSEKGLVQKRDGLVGAEAAAAVRRQRLFGARVRRLDRLAVIEVVVPVHQIDEQ